MSQVTAIIGDTSSIGYIATHPTGGGSGVYSQFGTRRNPQNAVARIRTVMNAHIVQEAPGGLISADFTIPAEEAQRWRPMLRYGAYCWLFDGHTPIFFGIIEQPTWTDSGDAQINVSGPWVVLGRSRTRELWEFRDVSQMPRGAHTSETRNASANVKADGTLELNFNRGETLASGDRVTVEYMLFDDLVNPVPYNAKRITGFEVHISDATFNSNANIVFRVQSISFPGDAGVTLWSSTATGSSGRQTANDVFGENSPAGAWASAPRGLRFGLFATAGLTAGGGLRVGLDRVRITTRESLFPTSTGAHDTAAIARDLLAPRVTIAGTRQEFDISEPFWPSDNSETGFDAAVKYGLDALTGTGSAPNSGIGITGFNIPQWTSPTEILLQLAGIDGYHVGFYLPYNQRGGYDAGNINDSATQSLWLSARPQLYYQAWPDPVANPDYTIHVREGASVEQDTSSAQTLANYAYTSYSTIRGRSQTVTFADGDPTYGTVPATNGYNYLSNQGFRVADDWSVDTPTNVDLANQLAQQMMELRRNPFAAATVTVTNDGMSRWPILNRGAQIPHLSQIRPGSVRLVDVPGTTGLRQGYATRVEWWGATLDQPEHVELTLSSPGQMMLERRLGWQALRSNRQRVSGG